MAKIAYTTIINPSGGKRYFSFLPPHGIDIGPWQSISYIGDVNERFISSWPYHTDKNRKPNKGKVQALKQAHDSGELIVRYDEAICIHQELQQAFRKISTLGRIDPSYK